MSGDFSLCDYEGKPKCIVVWGANPVWSNPDEYTGENLMTALSGGAKLIVVDPRLTYLAGRADIWLQLRPGTDAALALGMANVIVSEQLYDREFVDKHVHGWDKFIERVNEYSPEKVEEITWVPAQKIREAARLYAETKPAGLHWGVGIEHIINCADSTRSLISLMTITGNLDIRGGNAFFLRPQIQLALDLRVTLDFPPGLLAGNDFKVSQMNCTTTPKLLWDAILTEKPYPLKAMLLHGINPLVTRGNANEIHAALCKLDFLAIADFFITPTAEMADIVLPAATWLEIDGIANGFWHYSYRLPRRKIVQIGECWSDHQILSALGKRLGQTWGKDIEEDLDNILEPSGLSWNQFKEMPYLKEEMEYRKHEKNGFSTSTGKVELYSTIFEKLGYDPLPKYREIPESPISQPKLAKEYPYILTTGARQPAYFASESRMIPWLREIHPDPIVEIHPQVARMHGIQNGDWVTIETLRGKIKQKAWLTEGIDSRVIHAEYGWWYPEITTPDHGWRVSNANILTDNALETCDRAIGSTNLRAMLCKIYPAGKEIE
jgi:anaerobic selenocysteine-containing dehydrogenase